ncbi:MAG: class I SAM-dependent methyltransferase [Burkholderiaceae bacterium]
MTATQYRSDALYASFAELNSYISMLHSDVLALLYHYGAHAEQPILEIGPYIGGSTIALVRGILEGGLSARVTSVELGGEYRHPTYVTTDIVESLRANLKNYGVDVQVNLIVGHSRDPSVVDAVEEVFQREGSFGCFVIDSDGQVQEDIALYKRFLSPRCYLVVDDYYAPGAPGKEATTRSQLAVLEQQHVIESFGVHGWGTWFGRFI